MDYSKKLYYSISEVAGVTGVKAHVLRYWETEFPTLRPKKTRAGSRRYRQADIDAVLAIKELLYDKGFKIAGARKALRQEKAAEAAPAAPLQIDLGFEQFASPAQLAALRSELEAILVLVRELAPPKAPPLKKMAGRG
jgi:DNA-binding transcriptional MerR regulator